MAVYVVAPDSFKGTLTSEQVIAAMADEIRTADPAAEIRAFPMADGGEGTLAALRGAFTGAGRAIVEMAQTCGLTLIPKDERDPRFTSTYAFGCAIRSALDDGAEEIVLALGGSSTNDCGMGAARALGARFLDGDGRELEGRGADLTAVRVVDLSGMDPRIARTRFTALCDVDNPLLGPNGATYTFGPQKGATPEICAELEAGMASFADVLADATGVDGRDAFGAGAAGGMGLAARVLLEWHQNLPPVPGMWDLVGRCRSEFGARVFLLSNISLDFADRGAPRYPVLSQMEGCVFSAKVGLVKPKPAIFDYTLNKFGLRAEETLFIDDAPRNLAGAAACGIAGYRFEGDAAALGNYLSGLFSSRNR